MTSNKTNEERAQKIGNEIFNEVERILTSKIPMLVSKTKGWELIEQALCDAEKRGMLRAAEICCEAKDCEGWIESAKDRILEAAEAEDPDRELG